MRAASSHTGGIRTSGRLYCWGYDTTGQLGDGGINTDRATPHAGRRRRHQLDPRRHGDYHTCAIRTTGRLYCWGTDFAGQLGDGGTNTDKTTPTLVAGGATNWTTVTAGLSHTRARLATGRLYCWGRDESGQLGTSGPNADRTTPAPVAGSATNWTALTTGDDHTCARRATGRLNCWGSDESGQLGTSGPNANRATPTPVAGSATNWTTVTAGEGHTCAAATGRLDCWGSDESGQLGNGGPNANRATPTPVAGSATNWTTVTAGIDHTCAIRATGRLYCWGSDANGQLGDGGTNTNQVIPVQVAGRATDWTVVAAGGYHTCARIGTGRLLCWGFNSNAQLGDNTTTPSGVPVQVYA